MIVNPYMNSIFSSKLTYLSANLTVAFLAVASLGHLAAQSTVTLPMKVDSDISGVSVELTAVQKTGDTIIVRFKYINPGEKPADIHAQIQGQVYNLIYYVDTKNKKKYLVVRDTQNNPLCSSMQDLSVSPGETKSCWAKFPAPPSDVTAISVYVPGAPPFENVPITQ